MTRRLESIHEWIRNGLGFDSYTLKPASEDASFRRYYRIDTGNFTRVIMDAPPDKEDCRPFLEISRRLRDAGVHVPLIHASDPDLGFILMDDLGSTLYLDLLSDHNAAELYSDAIDALARMQDRTDVKGLPVYDERLLLAELRLFRDWLLDIHLHIRLDTNEERMLNKVYDTLISSALEQPQTFVHRDYHSRNLMHTKQANPGVLDYQDAVCGPLSYDLVSLLKDCYIKWPPEQILEWLSEYFRKVAPQLDPAVDREQFIRWFDLMGVQRHLKASGIFARLYHRDAKDGFLRDIPRTLSYILELEHRYPELAGLVTLIQGRVLPALQTRLCP
ncbi:MAG: hypothetical protein A3I78_10885 [Gammaproteobacteria bacterium RIFCSPLOWO2_02_FULL_56_15]|nr:MAG: hypothetical protein A3I78_10885 [Gammaproteobacteria bacterium RIFCSPLOWO2_02_FULL_56_15]